MHSRKLDYLCDYFFASVKAYEFQTFYIQVYEYGQNGFLQDSCVNFSGSAQDHDMADKLLFANFISLFCMLH